jgi:hypothetical protein
MSGDRQQDGQNWQIHIEEGWAAVYHLGHKVYENDVNLCVDFLLEKFGITKVEDGMFMRGSQQAAEYLSEVTTYRRIQEANAIP